MNIRYRGVINGKAGKARLTLSQPGEGADYAHPLALPNLKKFYDYAPKVVCMYFPTYLYHYLNILRTKLKLTIVPYIDINLNMILN
jgi:hypothetical protein